MASSSPTPRPHLQIFNPQAPSSASSCPLPTFSFFPLLPLEIRLSIWEYSLRRHRLIRIRLISTGESAIIRLNEFPSIPQPAGPWTALIAGHSILPKQLRITTESRLATLVFYRIHFPCQFCRILPTQMLDPCHLDPCYLVRGTFYFNPKYDFLKLTSEIPVKETLVEFLHDLKTTHDPQRIGVLNLALELNDMTANDLGDLHPSDLSSPQLSSFTQTLTQLDSVFFIIFERGGRQNYGPLSGLRTSEVWYNRSYPIMAPMVPFFQRTMTRDPRSIQADLKHVFVGTSDPRIELQTWQQFLTKWNIKARDKNTTEYRYALSFDSTSFGNQVYDQVSAERWLEIEDSMWTGACRANDNDGKIRQLYARVSWPFGAEHEDWKNEDLDKAVKPCFGFWLFPVEAMGPLQEEGLVWQAKRILDMTEYWPELAILELPP